MNKLCTFCNSARRFYRCSLDVDGLLTPPCPRMEGRGVGRNFFSGGGGKVEKIEVFFISRKAKIEEKFYVFGTEKRK